jgi:putative acetyltransferase
MGKTTLSKAQMTDKKYYCIDVKDAAQLAEAATLFSEYANSLPFELDFQDFEAELASLPGKYAEPDGCIILAKQDDAVAGCVAMRKIEPGICEMKRLYVRPAYRALGVGKILVTAIIEKGRAAGYAKMRLDTVASMQGAIKLYERFRFVPTTAYCENPLEDPVFLELDLTVNTHKPG